MRIVLALAILAGLLVACGDREPPAASGAVTYRADAFVLEDASHGPALCLDGVADSYPPQCDGVPIVGWDWGAVEGEEHASGARWGEFDVTGTYDGATFTVLTAGPPTGEGPPTEPIVWTHCPEPDSGWTAADPSRTGDADIRAASNLAEAQEDFAGVWIDTVDEGPGQGMTILNVAFTGDLDRHEAELREAWGGPLCLQVHERTFAELKRIQQELGQPDTAAELGLQMTWSSIDVLENTVELGVVVADAEAEAAVVGRYGEGAVQLMPALVRVA